MPYRVAIANAIRGRARLQSGADQRAIDEIRKALTACEKIGANLDRPARVLLSEKPAVIRDHLAQERLRFLVFPLAWSRIARFIPGFRHIGMIFAEKFAVDGQGLPIQRF